MAQCECPSPIHVKNGDAAKTRSPWIPADARFFVSYFPM